MTKVIHGGDIYQYTGKIIDFSSNINPLGLPGMVQDILSTEWRCLEYYPDLHYTALRRAIADKHALVSEDQVIVGNGAAEIIYLVGSLFQGKQVLIPMPSFGEYQQAVEQWGGQVELVFRKSVNRFALPMEEILRRLPDVDGLILCNPNNPTGNLLSEEELIRILNQAEAYGKIVVLDEAFIDFVSDSARSSGVDWLEEVSTLLVIRAFTKFYAMPGLRLGYGIGSREFIQTMRERQMPWSVNSLAAKIGEQVLQDEEYRAQSIQWIESERVHFMQSLQQVTALRVYPATANFLLCQIRGQRMKAADLKERLLDAGILIRDASSFCGLDESYFRVAIKGREDNEKLVAALQGILHDE